MHEASKAKGRAHSDGEFEPVDGNSGSDSEVGTIPLDIMDDEQQDIDDEDRQVLNERILGIINVFQSSNQNQNNDKL